MDPERFNFIVVENIDSNRKLHHRHLLETFAAQSLPIKINIKTLFDVLIAFEKNGLDLKTISSEYAEGTKYYNDFEFEGKIWRSTIDNRKAVFRGENVRFINIKLPNDGFIYTGKYVDNNSQYDDIKFDNDVVDFIKYIATKIDEKFLEKTWFSYNYDFNKIELYFKCLKESTILHIGFDYGSHIGYTDKKTYTFGELKKILNI